MCLTCRHSWRSMEGSPPAAFNFLGPVSDREVEQFRVAALCVRCAKHSDRENRITKALQNIWPDLKIVHVHDAPTTLS